MLRLDQLGRMPEWHFHKQTNFSNEQERIKLTVLFILSTTSNPLSTIPVLICLRGVGVLEKNERITLEGNVRGEC